MEIVKKEWFIEESDCDINQIFEELGVKARAMQRKIVLNDIKFNIAVLVPSIIPHMIDHTCDAIIDLQGVLHIYKNQKKILSGDIHMIQLVIWSLVDRQFAKDLSAIVLSSPELNTIRKVLSKRLQALHYKSDEYKQCNSTIQSITNTMKRMRLRDGLKPIIAKLTEYSLPELAYVKMNKFSNL